MLHPIDFKYSLRYQVHGNRTTIYQGFTQHPPLQKKTRDETF